MHIQWLNVSNDLHLLSKDHITRLFTLSFPDKDEKQLEEEQDQFSGW